MVFETLGFREGVKKRVFYGQADRKGGGGGGEVWVSPISPDRKQMLILFFIEI